MAIVLKRITSMRCLCGNSHVFIEAKMAYGEHNGVIGPGGHRPSWIEKDCYCPSCGLAYKSTEKNGIDDEFSEFEKNVIKNGIRFKTTEFIKSSLVAIPEGLQPRSFADGHELILVENNLPSGSLNKSKECYIIPGIESATITDGFRNIIYDDMGDPMKKFVFRPKKEEIKLPNDSIECINNLYNIDHHGKIWGPYAVPKHMIKCI